MTVTIESRLSFDAVSRVFTCTVLPRVGRKSLSLLKKKTRRKISDESHIGNEKWVLIPFGFNSRESDMKLGLTCQSSDTDEAQWQIGKLS
jgi:hypothetical protein